MVKNLKSIGLKMPELLQISHIFYREIFYSREIVYWHELARIGFLKSKNHIFTIT